MILLIAVLSGLVGGVMYTEAHYSVWENQKQLHTEETHKLVVEHSRIGMMYTDPEWVTMVYANNVPVGLIFIVEGVPVFFPKGTETKDEFYWANTLYEDKKYGTLKVYMKPSRPKNKEHEI